MQFGLSLGVLVLSFLLSSTNAISQTSPQAESDTQKASAVPQAHAAHLETDGVSLPLTMVKGFPFLEGSINGKTGKLLFDVGEPAAFAIDSHTVSAPNGLAVGHGFFGSGQTFDVVRFPMIDSLTLPSGLHFEKLTNIRGNPGLPLEQHITPDFIGWIGVKFWDGFVFKLDYTKPSVTFYRDDDARSGERRAEANERVAQNIAVTRASNGLFLFPIMVGSTPVTGTLDTGSHDCAWLTDDEIAALKKAGNLHEEPGGNFTISGITIDGHPVPPTRIDITRGRAPFAKGLPQPDAPLYQFGYEFLSRQKTVWDYGHNTVTLLAQ